MRYTIVGMGLMGTAVARALASSGHDVAVWNRTHERAQVLESHGITAYEDVESAVDHAETIVLVLLDQATAFEVLGGQVDRIAGKAIINLMTGTPQEAAEFSSIAAQYGARYLDGAIECYPHHIGSPEALINLSGDAEVWAQHEDALKSVAGLSTFVGADPGAANVLDAALAGTFHSVALGALCEALAFLKAAGIDPAGPEVSIEYALEVFKEEALHLVAAVASDDFTTTEATLEVYLGAVRQWRSSMLASGQRASLMTAHLHNLEIAEAAGHGALGFGAQVLTTSSHRA